MAADFDADGDTDFIVGNLGTNTAFKASENEPLTITYKDFDNDGVIDPILCNYIQHQSFPTATRDELFDQMPSLQKKFSRYQLYADAQLKDIFTAEQLANSTVACINNLNSIYLSNEGNRKFSIHPLPEYAQMSMINGLVITKTKNELNDIILAGNFYPFRVQQGPLDAGIGLVLANNGKGEFTPKPFAETGLNIGGDVRNIITVQAGKNTLLIAVKNNGAVQVIKKWDSSF